ncbi:MAG: nucleoside recognition domain-containing protein [Anaerovoracaceae bacterium]|nr:spore maturation protein [Bacillota bacterium]MDY3954386.1 nucleoside recognition domain-containing protein [Anaerovoracaceae bacterium]
MTFLSGLSLVFIPLLFSFVLIYALIKKAPIYDLFIEGAKEGLQTAVEILPFILAIFIGIEGLVSSGAMEWLEHLLAPLFLRLGIPEELISLVLLRPVSGSGSLVLVEEILESAGADSFAGRAASVMAGSCETVFYVLAVYFGVTGVKKIRHSLAAGLAGYVAGVAASVWLCRIL